MTDWIDKLAATLNDEQRRASAERAEMQSRNELIDARAQNFFDEIARAAAELAGEIEEKLGGVIGEVACHADTRSAFTVMNKGEVVSITLTIRIDAKGRQLVSETSKHGPRFRADGVSAAYPLDLARGNHIALKTPDGLLQESDEVASFLLREAFARDVLNP
jgi:hypothetical protein